MSKKPRGNIHKIREFELEKISLIDEFDILQIVGEGWFGKILLVEHRASQTEMVLKAVPKPYVSLRDFYREFHYGLHLGIHRNIVTTYDVAFETAGFYVFTQEYAPLGDLTSNVTDTGVGEVYSKRVAKQIAAAIDYMHTKDIVHRDVKLDNVLIYRSDFSRVKLCDFGESYQTGTLVERRNEWLPYSPPEVLDVKAESSYKADPNHDVWQFGIVIFVCLTGCLPWQKAASDDPRYVRYLAWQGSMMLPIRRTPKLFKLLSSRAQRMFRRFLEPRADRRPKSLADLNKFLDDRWLAKSAEKEMAEYETDELCPSMYSFHSSPDEKHRLLYTLADCGIETNVDRQQKKNRIKDWIESSVITEEDEEENEENYSASPSSSVSREPMPGHISSIRAVEKAKEIKTTLKDAKQKHFDPRTGALQQGPSEMGATLMPHDKSSSPSQLSNYSTQNNNDSLAGSLLTLGSRQDLIASNLEIYNSMDAHLNRLGEHYPDDDDNNSSLDDEGYVAATLSMGNLAATNARDEVYAYAASQSSKGAVLKNSIGVGTTSTRALNATKSILQRSKSDSVKTALYSSTPAINNQQHQLQSGFAPNGSAYFAALPQSQSGNNKSVTFTGLANNFQTLAHITLPASMSINNLPQQQQPQQQQQQMQQLNQLQQQQQQQHYFNQNNSLVKDSAYNSIDVSESSAAGSSAFTTMRSNNLQQTAVTPLTSAASKQSINSTVRTQTSQQRRYNGASTASGFVQTQTHTQTISTNRTNTAAAASHGIAATANSMKDSAYDRFVAANNNAKKRR